MGSLFCMREVCFNREVDLPHWFYAKLKKSDNSSKNQHFELQRLFVGTSQIPTVHSIETNMFLFSDQWCLLAGFASFKYSVKDSLRKISPKRLSLFEQLQQS